MYAYIEPNPSRLHDVASDFDDTVYFRRDREDTLCFGDENGYDTNCTLIVHLSGNHHGKDVFQQREEDDREGEVKEEDEELARV